MKTPRPPPPKAKSSGSKSEGTNEDSHSEDVDYNQSYVTANKQRSDPNKVLIWVSASCLLAIVLLIGIPVVASMMLKKNKGDNNSTVAANNVNKTKSI